MKKTIVFLLFILAVNHLQAQNDVDDFLLMIALKYEETPAIQIDISDLNSKATLHFKGTECPAHEFQNKINVSDTYYYQQFRDYLTQIDLATFEPSSEDDALLQIKIVYKSQSENISNVMHFGYNPDHFSELNTFFEYFLQTLDANIIKTCDRDFYVKVKKYLEGE